MEKTIRRHSMSGKEWCFINLSHSEVTARLAKSPPSDPKVRRKALGLLFVAWIFVGMNI